MSDGDTDKKRKDQRKFAEEDKADQQSVDQQAFDEFTVLQDVPSEDMRARQLHVDETQTIAEDISASGNLNYQQLDVALFDAQSDLQGSFYSESWFNIVEGDLIHPASSDSKNPFQQQSQNQTIDQDEIDELMCCEFEGLSSFDIDSIISSFDYDAGYGGGGGGFG